MMMMATTLPAITTHLLPSLSLATESHDPVSALTNGMSENAIASTSPSESENEDHDNARRDVIGYAMLKFPDAQYVMKTLQLTIGRDMFQYHGLQFLSQQVETQLLLDANQSLFPSTNSDIDPVPTLSDQNPEKKIEEIANKAGKESLNKEDAQKETTKAGDAVMADNSQKPIEPVAVLQPAADITESYKTNIDESEVPYPDEPFLAVHQGKTVGMFGGHDLPDGGPISRKHLSIKYNRELERFELQILGRNGAFVNGSRYHQGESLTLKHQDRIILSGCEFTFVLPVIDGPEPSTASGKLSYQFEGVNYSDVSDDSREDYTQYTYRAYLSSDTEGQSDSRSDDSNDDEIDTSSDEDEIGRHGGLSSGGERQLVSKNQQDATRIKIRIKPDHRKHRKHHRVIKPTSKMKELKHAKFKQKISTGGKKPLTTPIEEVKPKQKNTQEADKEPSPKSREDPNESPVQRVARDESLRNGDGIQILGLPEGYVIPPRKKGPGRPPKDGCMSKRERSQLLKQFKEQEKAKKLGIDPSTIVIPEPAKAARPRKNSINGDGVEKDGDAGSKNGDLEKKKTIKPPRSPSPQLRKEDYTAEQLQKPSGTYATWVYDAIKESPQQKLNLQQIYHALEKKYPYFKFTVNGFGWQSSVRHNLAQYPAVFEKVEKDGKGWLWGIKDGAVIERERKKRSPPPPVYPPSQSYPHPYPHHPQHMPPNGIIPHAAGSHPPTVGYGMAPGSIPPTGSTQPPRPPTGATNQPLAHHNPSRPPAYASSYTTAGPRPHPTNQQHHYQSNGSGMRSQPSHATQYGATHGRPNAQSSAPITYQRPSDDVIDVFKTVFKKSLPNKGGPIDQDTAERIVNNAVSRVLDPDTMLDVPLMDREQSVIDAFRGCLERSQAPRTANTGPLASSSRPGMNGSAGPRPSAPSPLTHASASTAVHGNASQYGATTRPHSMTHGTSIAPPAPVTTVPALSNTSNLTIPSAVSSTRSGPIPSGSHTPQPPMVEAITPPELSGRKRSIAEVGGVEESEAKKAALVEAVTSVLGESSTKK